MKMYTMILAVALFWVTGGFTQEAAKTQISIIVNKANKNKPDEQAVKDIFVGAKLAWPSGEKILIADQTNTDLGNMFYEKFIKELPRKIHKQWTKLVLSGQTSAPLKCKSDDEVKKAVAENTNSIGFIVSGKLDDSVIEIFKFEEK